MAARTFEDLIVWQKAYRFVLGLIAEGFKKRGKLDKVRFMNMAQGSIEESRCYLLLSNDLGYGETKLLLNHLEEVSRLLESYSRAILNSVILNSGS